MPTFAGLQTCRSGNVKKAVHERTDRLMFAVFPPVHSAEGDTDFASKLFLSEPTTDTPDQGGNIGAGDDSASPRASQTHADGIELSIASRQLLTAFCHTRKVRHLASATRRVSKTLVLHRHCCGRTAKPCQWSTRSRSDRRHSAARPVGTQLRPDRKAQSCPKPSPVSQLVRAWRLSTEHQWCGDVPDQAFCQRFEPRGESYLCRSKPFVRQSRNIARLLQRNAPPLVTLTGSLPWPERGRRASSPGFRTHPRRSRLAKRAPEVWSEAATFRVSPGHQPDSGIL